jgi:hypothetical protein
MLATRNLSEAVAADEPAAGTPLMNHPGWNHQAHRIKQIVLWMDIVLLAG